MHKSAYFNTRVFKVEITKDVWCPNDRRYVFQRGETINSCRVRKPADGLVKEIGTKEYTIPLSYFKILDVENV